MARVRVMVEFDRELLKRFVEDQVTNEEYHQVVNQLKSSGALLLSAERDIRANLPA